MSNLVRIISKLRKLAEGEETSYVGLPRVLKQYSDYKFSKDNPNPIRMMILGRAWKNIYTLSISGERKVLKFSSYQEARETLVKWVQESPYDRVGEDHHAAKDSKSLFSNPKMDKLVQKRYDTNGKLIGLKSTYLAREKYIKEKGYSGSVPIKSGSLSESYDGGFSVDFCFKAGQPGPRFQKYETYQEALAVLENWVKAAPESRYGIDYVG